MKALSTILNLIIVMGIAVTTLYACDMSIKRRERYEIEHNCKYDYNDLCYTREERPWLFN